MRRSTAVAAHSGIWRRRWLVFGEVWVFALFAVLLAVLAYANETNWPLQLEMRVPFEPTAFPSAGHTYLTYELYLTNVGTTPITFERLEVLDAQTAAAKPIAAFEDGQLNTLLQRVGDPMVGDSIPEPGDNSRREIAPGRSVVVYLSIAFEASAHVPNELHHRVFTADSSVDGAIIGTHYMKLRVLGPPVEGARWVASSGPSNDSHHRRGILVLGGNARISRRYAIDWTQTENGAMFAGDARDRSAYYAYGKAVLAVADGTAITVRDGLPDNVPGHNEAFHPAVPLSFDTLAGNTITLDLGGGLFAYYMHLRPGSVRVKAGDRVRRSQVIAKIGDSGDAREPHLHFEVTTAPNLLAGEGVPYLIDQYSVKSAGDIWERRTRELPMKDMLIDFGRRGSHPPLTATKNK